ncbi:MAG TPA: glutathione S-transferase [Acidocella sp.]|nr:glutathione S-transferase [Acidocella sp.]
MVIVHHLNNSRSQRVLWLLEELGVDYEVKRYERDPKTMLAPPELRAVHPLGKSPVITDGDKTIAETGAIVDYLIETYGGGRLIPPVGSPERLRYNYWMHYAEGSAMPPLVMKLILTAVPKSPQLPFFLKPVARLLFGGVAKNYVDPQIAAHIEFWAGALEKSAYFAGDELTGADIMMSFPLEAAQTRGKLPPLLNGYLAGLHGRPAYKRALERGGPYTLLGD